jgi:hypothetical protein
LERLKPEQAIVALLPRFEDLVLTLHCHVFSCDISAHRLWFIAGDNWPAQMAKLFEKNPGLPLPQQFIRTALLHEDASGPLIATAQKIFADELTRRGAVLSDLQQGRSSSFQKRITVAAPMRFRLWDDAGGVLQQIFQGRTDLGCTFIDFDDPAQVSPLALAQAAAESDAVLTANLTRADCAQFLHPQIPLISWLTTRPIPAFDSSSRDLLLLPDVRLMEAAKQSGWPANRLFFVPWPQIAAPNSSDSIAIIADTRPIDPSPAFDLSSHQLLWDLVRAELQAPIPISDIRGYLLSRMKRLNITDHGLDQRRFIEELIIPAYQQSLASHLLKANIALKIFGEGWRGIGAFAPHAVGPISSREELKQAIANCAALLHAWPGDHPHPIDTAGPPVIRLTSRGPSGLVADARLARSGKLIKPALPAADAFDMAELARIVRAAMAA